MLFLYQWVTKRSAPLLERLLQKRLKKGKEDPERIDEKRGIPSKERPSEPLIWLHAASVGEAQSALILIKAILNQSPDLRILVTTGTLTSAKRMADSLPAQAFHQFAPLDHPEWVERFLHHWQPNLVLWMESELWPNTLNAIKTREIPATLINARLSDRSFKRWSQMKSIISPLLATFDTILCQTDIDAERFHAFGATQAVVSDNIKYSAAPLSCDEDDLKALLARINGREVCVFASTHAGEEEMIARIHSVLRAQYPSFLTIIVPRHPERGKEICSVCEQTGADSVLRGKTKILPDEDTDIYVANTLGELGLFYRVSPIVYIGRSLSKDGGGGHNPIEAAQLGCAILHGPNIQNLQDIYDDMMQQNASLCAQDEEHLTALLMTLFSEPDHVKKLSGNALNFSKAKSHVIDTVMQALKPYLEKLQTL